MGITQEVDFPSILHVDTYALTFSFALQTINHRKLVQELYDQRVLHSILGINPLPAIVKHDQSDDKICQSPSSKRQASKVVEDAWEEMRRTRDYTYERSRQQHHRISDDYEEDGRYDIERHPPKKRRKTGRGIDDHHHNHVVFVDDDERRWRWSVVGMMMILMMSDDDDNDLEDSEYSSHPSYEDCRLVTSPHMRKSSI